MAPSSNDGPLPVAAPALSSRIAMLFAAHPSPLSLSGGRTARPNRPADHRQSQAQLAEDEALFKGAYLPNGGVGYAPPPAASGDSDATAATKELRSRILGKRERDSKADRERWARKKGVKTDDTDDTDEEVGRSALGKRKRPRREAQTADKQGGEDDERGGKEEDGMTEGEADSSAAAQVVVEESTQPATMTTTTTTKRKKNKKKKNKAQST